MCSNKSTSTDVVRMLYGRRKKNNKKKMDDDDDVLNAK